MALRWVGRENSWGVQPSQPPGNSNTVAITNKDFPIIRIASHSRRYKCRSLQHHAVAVLPNNQLASVEPSRAVRGRKRESSAWDRDHGGSAAISFTYKSAYVIAAPWILYVESRRRSAMKLYAKQLPAFLPRDSAARTPPDLLLASIRFKNNIP